MYPGGYTAEVTCLSPRATEKDVYDFFAHCGVVEHVEIIRSGEYSCTAYVTFKDAYALETAVLLSGAKIADQHVCISCWGTYIDESDPWNNPSWKLGDENSSTELIMLQSLRIAPILLVVLWLWMLVLVVVGAKHVYAAEAFEMAAYAGKLTVVTTIDHLSTKLWFESILPHLLQLQVEPFNS